MPNETEKKDAFVAHTVLALQEEDENPYDVSDEMLVAYSEGKLTSQEAKVIARCLANNPEAMASAVALSRRHLAQKAAASNNVFNRIFRHFIDKIDYRQRVTLSGMVTASLIALAIIFILPKNNYHDFDVAFNELGNASNKPSMIINQDLINETPNNIMYKGSDSSFFYGALRQGIKDGLLAFVILNDQQFKLVTEIPQASNHCNNAMPLKSCNQLIKQGRYVGQFIAWLHAECLKSSHSDSVNTGLNILPILNDVDAENLAVLDDLQRMANDALYECKEIESHVSLLLIQ